MDSTFTTVLSGVSVFVIGQATVKLLIDPVQEMKRTIGAIAHALTEHAQVISNPGLLGLDKERGTSEALRKLSAQLETHLYLVPRYDFTRVPFGLPPREKVLKAASHLIGLSNSVFASKSENIYERNAMSVERIHDALGIYMRDHDRISKILDQESGD